MCDVDKEATNKIKKPLSKDSKIYAKLASEMKMKGLMFKDIGMAAINELRALKNKIIRRIDRMEFVKTLKRHYRRRPDLGIFVIIIGCVLLLFVDIVSSVDV